MSESATSMGAGSKPGAHHSNQITFRDRVVSRDVASRTDQEIFDYAFTQRMSNVSALGCVERVTSRACSHLLEAQYAPELVRTIRTLVESVVWPFVCFRTESEGKLFDGDDLVRFTNSIANSAEIIAKYAVLGTDNKEQTMMKYWLDRLFCFVSQSEELPPRPEWLDERDELFSGFCRTGIKRALAQAKSRKGRTAFKALSFIYSLQKGSKQMWPALGDEKKQAALNDHAVAFGTKQPDPDSELIDEVENLSMEMNRRTDVTANKFCPSSSACLQASRDKGGALGLFDSLDLEMFTKGKNLVADYPNIVYPLSGLKFRMGKLRELNTMMTLWRNKSFHAAEVNAWRDLQTNLRDGKVGVSTLRGEESEPRSVASEVGVIAIPEPGKFRIISKGNGWLYSALQPLQGVLLENWKSRPEGTMTSPDLTDKVRRINDATKSFKDFQWESVDYKAATDTLKSAMTRAVLGPLNHLPGWELGMMSVKPGVLIYPDGRRVLQEEGQLMGHPLSFTCLCTINLAVWRLSVKQWVAQDSAARGEMGKILQGSVIVNGDDLLARMSPELSEIFWRNAKSAGFKRSVGKSYRSPDTCQINSQVFKVMEDKVVRVGYLNLRLITGANIKNGDSAALPTQVGRELSSMIKFCPWAARSVNAAFRRWGSDFFARNFTPNWYLPVHLGGFGMDARMAPDSWRVTRPQRVMAAHFVNHPELALYASEMTKVPRAKAIRIASATLNFRLRRGDDYDVLGEEYTSADEWLTRICLAARLSGGSNGVDSDRKVARLVKPDYRLKPMSLEGVLNYWDRRLIAVSAPVCPPLVLKTYSEGTVAKVRAARYRVMAENRREISRVLREGQTWTDADIEAATVDDGWGDGGEMSPDSQGLLRLVDDSNWDGVPLGRSLASIAETD